jgi:hypothetical protein
MFFVFGVSETIVKKAADKKCSRFTGTYPNRRELSLEEYQQKLSKTRDDLFAKMKAQERCRDIEIKYRKPTGAVNPKTKKDVLEWTTYIG